MAKDQRIKQVVAGLAVIIGVAGLILLITFGRFLPGLGGEFFGRILGIISTPFLMETSFLILGFVIVMSLNLWRQRREGDELVDFDELRKDPEATTPGTQASATGRVLDPPGHRDG